MPAIQNFINLFVTQEIEKLVLILMKMNGKILLINHVIIAKMILMVLVQMELTEKILHLVILLTTFYHVVKHAI